MESVTNIKQAVILAGGMGLRLRPYTYENPKVVVPVNGKPFLYYLLTMLKKRGIEEVVVLLGYMPDKVQAYLGDGSQFGLKVSYSVGAVEDETGKRLRAAKDLLDEKFLLLYCDNFMDFDLAALSKFHDDHHAMVTMTVYTNRYGFTKNNTVTDADGYVAVYDSSRTAPGLNGVDTGFFLFEKRAIDMMEGENPRLNKELFPKLIAGRKLAAFLVERQYYSLSTPERLKITERMLGPQKVVFLDRDGVMNKKAPKAQFILKPEQFEFLPTAIEAVKLLCDKGYEIYLISNQAGIGKKLMTEGDLFNIHKYMEEQLAAGGAKLNGIYYCPHDWEEGCFCRKPKPGMFYQASVERQIDLPRAIFIGDDERDKEAGDAAGVQTILMESDGDLLKVVQSLA